VLRLLHPARNSLSLFFELSPEFRIPLCGVWVEGAPQSTFQILCDSLGRTCPHVRSRRAACCSGENESDGGVLPDVETPHKRPPAVISTAFSEGWRGYLRCSFATELGLLISPPCTCPCPGFTLLRPFGARTLSRD